MSLVVGTIEELEHRLNAFGVALVGAPLGRQLIEALARAEKAESVRDEATERAARYQRHWSTEVDRAEQAERERDAMHAAAEELRAQGAELGENQWRCPDGGIATVRRCGIGNVEFDGPMPGTGFSYPICGDKLGEVLYGEGLHDFACAYHLKHYTLLPDECRERGKPPRKMVDGEVRLLNGAPTTIKMRGTEVVIAPVGSGRGWWWHPRWHGSGNVCADHPANDPSQVARIIAFWSRNAPTDICLTDDGRSVRTMAPNEVRDVVTGRVLPLTRVYGANGELGARIPKGGGEDWLFFRDQVSFPETHPCSLPSNRLRVEAFLATSTRPSDSGQLSTDGATRKDALVEEPGKQIRPVSDKSESAAVLPEAHSGSPSGECPKCKGTGRSCGNRRCDYQWCASCKACNGTGRKAEESDGKTEEAHGGQRSATPVQPGGQHDHRCQSTPSHVQEVSGDPGVGETQQAAASKVRPLGVPASATIWAEVVDGLGRKVGAWFEPRHGEPVVRMKDPDGGAWYWDTGRNGRDWDGSFEKSMTPSAAAQCRQLYERGMKEQAEIKAWAENMAGFVCDESIDTGAKVAAVLAAEATHQAFAEDLEDFRPSAEELAAAADARCEEVPATGPRTEESDESHSAQDSEGVIQAHGVLANGERAEGDDRQREGDMQELHEATRPVCIRWVGWERTLTAVDLTELREAANKRRDYLALSIDARSPLQETLNDRAVLSAVEKLLASGGAP